MVSSQKITNFVGQVTDTRNFFTHHPTESDGEPMRGRKLQQAKSRLQVLLHVLLLKELGFEEADIVSRIRMHPRLNRLAEPQAPASAPLSKARAAQKQADAILPQAEPPKRS
jgi:hypothetical protein